MKKLLAYLAIIGSLICFSIPASHAAVIDATFNDLDEMFLGTGSFGEFEFNITNNTGVTWTDFHFYDAEPIGAIDIDSYSGPGTASLDSLFQIDILGLNVLSGDTLTFSITEFCGIAEICSLGGTIWFGFPTTDGEVSVPEPTSLLLLSMGLLLLRLIKRID